MNGSISRCRACGEQIVWIRTRAGKNMPCNLLVHSYRAIPAGKDKIVTPEGDVVSGEIIQGEPA